MLELFYFLYPWYRLNVCSKTHVLKPNSQSHVIWRYGLWDMIRSVQFNCSVVWLFATPRTAARQASLSISNSWSLLKLMSIASVMPSNHLILCGQIRTSKKRGGGSQRHFKSQVENYEISVCLSGFMYASVCVFWGLFVFYNIDEVVNEF